MAKLKVQSLYVPIDDFVTQMLICVIWNMFVLELDNESDVVWFYFAAWFFYVIQGLAPKCSSAAETIQILETLVCQKA